VPGPEFLRLAPAAPQHEVEAIQILIRVADKETEQRALGKLIPRFSGKIRASGETAVPAQALGFLAERGINRTVIGPAPYEFITPVRDPGGVAV
jgi:hypothetical protein